MEEVKLNKPYYRSNEAAKHLGVHVETVRRWIREGKLEVIRTCGGHSRIHRDTILAMLQKKP